MAKVSQIDKAIAALKAERDVLDLAIAKLQAQQVAKAAVVKSRGRKSKGITSINVNLDGEALTQSVV